MVDTDCYRLYNKTVQSNTLQEQDMPYTLIDAKGKVMRFYVLELAEMYRLLQGGTIIVDSELEERLYGQAA